MKRRWVLGLVLLAAAAVATVWAQQRDWSQEKITAEQVRGNIWMLVGAGGNIGVSVGPDGILIVDDKFLPLADKIRAALAERGPGKLKFILNTHWHGDHTGANPVFGPEALIIAQTNVRERLKTGNRAKKIEPLPKEGWPVITFDQSLSVHFNGEEIKVIHFPHGHTDGDSVIFFTGSNVVHMGDDFFAGHFPYVDLDSGGDVEGLINNVAAIIGQLPADVKIIPGHGPLSTKEDVKKFTDMLHDCIGLVQAAMKKKMSLEQMKKVNVLTKYDALGKGFVNTNDFIELIYNELKGDITKTKQKSTKHH